MNNEKKLGLDSAFPVSDPNTALAMFNAGVDPTGMSKRFYAACMAMQGLLANDGLMELTCDKAKNKKVHDSVLYAKMAYEYADELLKAEQL